MPRKKQEKVAPDTKKQEQPKQEENNLDLILDQLAGSENRMIGVFGDIDEERSAEIIMSLLLLSNKEDDDQPLDFYISTYGGNSDDMFAIYDIMTHVKKKCAIHTHGIGKVMSAGTLLLAAGTKGKRKVGKHCRVMIHSCNAGNMGDLHNLENELKAVQEMQDSYINALVSETSMTKRQLQKLLDRKVNVYLTAEEAIEYGIADEII